MSEIVEGWGWPGLAKKAHYFPSDSPISLCGKWMYNGRLEPETEKRSLDDCVACRRALDKRLAAAGEPSRG